MPLAHDSNDELVRFRRTPQGIALNRAFDRFTDPRIRRRIIDLARAAALRRERGTSAMCQSTNGESVMAGHSHEPPLNPAAQRDQDTRYPRPTPHPNFAS
jgi:hypothetical protein